nr:hypothetical protein CTI12_AA091630 [Tanacetum cinerariifolium]
MKCTAAIRQLAYDNPPDAFDKYLQMSGHTTRGCLFYFNKCIIDLYMSRENTVAGANNDINDLDNSPLFDDLIDDKAHVALFVVNGGGFEKGYYLADGIYPQWVIFVKSFTVANDVKHNYFKKRQEIMSSDSHATITYTSMSSYKVIVNEYFGMHMDPLDPYVQLVMKAPPSPDYIPGPEAPPLPDYIPGPEAPPSPDYIPGPEAPPFPNYIPGPEYLEYVPPPDDVLPAEEQPLPAAVSPTAESLGYITDLESKMEPEEEDIDDEKSEEDSIDYPASRGDDDADDDGDDLSEDDVDEEESSDSEEEEEEHLALTVPALALHSSISASGDSDET